MRQLKKQQKKEIKFILLLISLVCIVTTVSIAIRKQNSNRNNLPPVHIIKNSTNEDGWCLILVNKWNPISSDNDIETIKLPNGKRIDKRIYPYLQEMFEAMQNDGIYPIVASGYRTEREQSKIYNDKISDYKDEGLSYSEAKKETEHWVAAPGTSEHQIGLAVDINADGIHSKGKDVYEWLKNNAHLYGFIYRYQPDKVYITGVANEPWHYRYVGIKAAAEIYNKGISLEEYLGKNR